MMIKWIRTRRLSIKKSLSDDLEFVRSLYPPEVRQVYPVVDDAPVSSRGVGGSGHGYNSLLKPAGEALQVNKVTFTIRASDSPWHPGLPGRPSFPLEFREVYPVVHNAPVDRYSSQSKINYFAEMFRGRLILKAHILCVPLNSGLENNEEEERRCTCLGVRG